MSKRYERICVVGLGYIGLPTAATFASRGLEVIGVDTNERVVSKINAGQAHFSEPELDMLLSAAVTTQKLRAVGKPEPAEAFIIAVPTPLDAHNHADMHYVDSAVDSIARVLRPGNLVVLESTSPVGTTARIAERLAAQRPDLRFPTAGRRGAVDIHLAHCPERILPGQMVRELVENDRIIGGLTDECALRARELYELFVRGECIFTDAATAELVKLAENAYRDVNIAFANEMSMICDQLELNVWNVIELANRHPRVDILKPGPGVGGHCISVDPWFIVGTAPEAATLIRTAREVNGAKPDFVVKKVAAHADRFKSPVIACLGLTYKPDVDDLRESPALHIVSELARMRVGSLLVVEPQLEELPNQLRNFENLQFSEPVRAVRQADIIVILVSHAKFRRIPPDEFLNRIVIDTTGLIHRA
jgi:UDP-N-acetyl-D-mannosaminuronic acid dehydrogenase